MLNKTKAEEILEGLFGYRGSVELYTSCYIGLHVGETAPNDDGSGFVEPVEKDDKNKNVGKNDYKRILIGSASEKTDSKGNVIGWDATKSIMSVPTIDTNDDEVPDKRLDRVFRNSETIYFDEAYPGGWGSATHFGLFDTDDLNQTAPYMWGKLTDEDGNANAVEIPERSIPIFRKGCFEVSLKDEEETI